MQITSSRSQFLLKLRFAALLCLIISSLSSCGGDKDEDPEPDPSSSTTFGIRHDRILEDYEEVATNVAPFNTTQFPDFTPVVHFEYSLDGSDNFDYVASGILIDSVWILTAGHNFFVSDNQANPAPVSGIQVNLGNNPNNPDASYDVAELIFHPTWLSDDRLFESANDLCLVKLAQAITDIDYAVLNNSLNEEIGTTTWYCGFGDYSSQPGQDASFYSKKHAIENTLDRVIDGISSQTDNGTTYSGGLVAFDFDSPLGDINSLGDSYTSQDEPLLGLGTSLSTPTYYEGSTVQGDSGGPLFAQIEGEWVVIGILSGGATEPIINHEDSSYGDISIFTRVSTSLSWIESVMQPAVL